MAEENQTNVFESKPKFLALEAGADATCSRWPRHLPDFPSRVPDSNDCGLKDECSVKATAQNAASINQDQVSIAAQVCTQIHAELMPSLRAELQEVVRAEVSSIYNGSSCPASSPGGVTNNAKPDDQAPHAIQQGRETDKKIQGPWFEQQSEGSTCHTELLQSIASHLKQLVEASKPKLKKTCRSHESVLCPAANPTVEVSTRILDLPRIKVDEQVCSIDVVICIDWSVDYKPGDTFPEGPQQDWSEDAWARFFNPSIKITNSTPEVEVDIGCEQLPRSDKVDDAGYPMEWDDGKAWMKKTMRYCGQLALPSNSGDLTKFPFDIHVLSIRLQGDDKRSKLKTPIHRPNQDDHKRYRQVALQDPKRVGDGQLLSSTAMDHLTGLGYGLLGIRVAAKVLDRDHVDHARYMKRSSEFSRPRNLTDPFVVEIIITRKPCSSYILEIIIMQLMVLLAATSLYDVAELSGRLSISMTILLTLAAFTTNKPTPVAQSEANTYHDRSERLCLLLVVLVCLSNVVSAMMCGGEDDETPAFLQELYKENVDQCSLGWCLSRKIDCHFIIGFAIVFLSMMPFRVLYWFCDYLFRKHKRITRLKRKSITEQLMFECNEDPSGFKGGEQSWESWSLTHLGEQQPAHRHPWIKHSMEKLAPVACRLWCFCNRLEPHCVSCFSKVSEVNSPSSPTFREVMSES
eukprot:gnl/MRDRNA2_/MRDRNA2_58399_c0_seq1.p1 gnl/MRDRNA2_/MRDRNA2_58399_c0~~gnl/MRDRNA2_/MRDRNA2_58399_c0_seq1.p1  ORF type:complete len:710 (+),score=97.13 gnl/MRDRNA2_/MRDRNA2_58399_c0_seq1:68-2131(+)